MILPNKYINLAESLLGFSAYLTLFLGTPKTLDELWLNYQQQLATGAYPVSNSFNDMVLSIDLLYLLGLIKAVDGGAIVLDRRPSSAHQEVGVSLSLSQSGQAKFLPKAVNQSQQ
jgi:hypothetical protein